jgi:alkylation response protein AidB-like acyl-CoA dehydrogenase
VVDEASFRDRVGTVLDRLDPQLPPADVLRSLGAAGVFADRWSRDDATLGVALVDEVAGRGRFEASVAVGLHVEAFTGILRRFGSDTCGDRLADALAGTALGCIGTTEPQAGSDLTAVHTTVLRDGGGWRVQGEKKLVTLSPSAGAMLVLGTSSPSAFRPALVLVPRSGYEVLATHRMEGCPNLDTSWVRIDAHVPAGSVLGRPGMGVAILTHGLVGERLAISAQVLATCRLALSLAVTRAHRRTQGGSPIWDHQVIRLRLAELHAERVTLSAHLRALAADPRPDGREVAGLKLLTARFGERCLSEAMHVFGADGYIQGATPLGHLWRSIRVGRIGGGTDEVMAEVVANGLRVDDATYDAMVRPPDQHPPTP